jgi:H+-translocating NAD(P) transhydrogenase subunit alpha
VRIGVPRETVAGEQRVALVPDVVRRLGDDGHAVVVEAGAGAAASLPDGLYAAAGADFGDPWACDVVAKVAPPTAPERERLHAGQTVVGFLAPLADPAGASALAATGVTGLALELVPRISRAQTMDALSSQATVAGYRAALIGAQELGRFYPMLMTAAGTVPPAQVLVLGAGVAGLQAIATARRLGAVVTGFDVRASVREQVESLGARFLAVEGAADAEAAGGYARELTAEEQAAQAEAVAGQVARSDVVITTALVPGRPAPRLVSAEAVARMRTGSVIVDLAGEAGGNCELARPGETYTTGGVTIAAPLNLPSSMPEHASSLYARNVAALLGVLAGAGFEDEIVAGSCLCRDGELVHAAAQVA